MSNLNLNGKQISIMGDVTVTGNIDIAHGKLSVNGKVNQTGGIMTINGGTLDISGDYIIATEGKNSTTEEFEYQAVRATLEMSKAADIVNVGGDFCVYASDYYQPRNTLSAGTMTIGGNFTQKGTDNYTADCFQAEGSHTVILNGTGEQKISFDSTSSHFNILRLTKNKETGYSFTPDNCWKTLQLATEIAPHKHTEVVDKAIAPTCTETGLTEGKHCLECNKVLVKQKVLKALGHSYVNGVCSRCGALETKIPIKGQKLTDNKSGAVYKIISVKSKVGTVEYTKPLNNKTTNISIPSKIKIDGISYKVTSIATNAFKNNKKITKVKIGRNVTFIGKNAFSGCSKLKNLTIGNNVVSIGDNAFLNCTSLKTVTIPAKVTKIGKQAFCGCKRLKTIKLNTKKLVSKNVGNKVFAKIDPKAVVKVPASCLKSYKKLLQKKGINGKKQKIKK